MGPGLGATFTITLPVRAVAPRLEDARATGTADAATSTPPTATELRDVHVLLVEDDEDSRDLIRLVLEEGGARVTTASRAREALEARGPFDVIISDIGMAEMDGYAFMRHVRSRDAGGAVPAIALTAYARSEDADRALRAGYQQHLSKPVEPGELLRTVKNWATTRPR